MKIFLSHSLNNNTPTYGNRSRVSVSKIKSIKEGSTVNESTINLPLHCGTHIDFPHHFFSEKITQENYEADFWFFNKPIIIEVEQSELIIDEKIIDQLKQVKDKASFDILLVKTGATAFRSESRYWEYNYGLSPNVADYLKEEFTSIRVVGMDFISLSSYQHSDAGKAAHYHFLDPKSPILVIEDMDLTKVDANTTLREVIVCPLRIDGTDGVPVTCFGITED
ncbi:MAG: cyclase [Balneola sp.]|nr:MAG: cyclase [Balneola sp.]